MESRQIQQIANYLIAGQTADLFKFYAKDAEWLINPKVTVNGVFCFMYVISNDDGFDFVLLNGDGHQVYNEPVFKLSRLIELINETDLEINNFYVMSSNGSKML